MQELETQLVQAADGRRLMEYTAAIARWVRLSGTPEELEAFGWVEATLQGFGLKTRLIMHDAYISLPGKAALSVAGLGAIEAITHAMAVSGSGTAEIVGGPGANAAGKILLVDGLATPAGILEAQARGAAALLAVNDENHHEMIVSPVWGSPTVEEADKLPTIPALSVRRADGDQIRALLQQHGTATATFSAQVETGWRRTPLLLADLPGESPDFVLFSGHLDSWHLGAMDNGSANAVMIEVARLISTVRDRLKRGLRLAFWSGHSHGRYSGSTWYADQHWQELFDHCAVHVNVDSAGGIGATILSEGMAHPELIGLGADVISRYTGVHYEGRRVNRSSDQSLVGIGIPSLWAGISEQAPGADTIGHSKLFGSKSGGLGWWWHTVHDTLDKVDPHLLLRDCKCYVAAMARLLLSDRIPLDPEASAAGLRAELQDWADRAGSRFDLSAAVALATKLVEATRALKSADIPAARYNGAVRRISRWLISVAYSEAGPFSHDPALPVPPLPALKRIDDLVATVPGSDAERFVLPLAVRGRNRVIWSLENALREVELCLNDR